MTLKRVGVLAGLVFARLYGQTTCVNFPSGLVPFTSIYYVTAADSAGDHVVVGLPSPDFSNFLDTVPPPAFANQTFCDTQVQLAPQQFYSNVYVPTAAERAGNFQAFSGLLISPATNQPYPNGVFPESGFNTVWGLRIGPAQVASSGNGGWSPTGSMTTPEAGHATVLLPSGKVLVAGGDGTAQIYDPATGAFTNVGQMLFPQGVTLTATLLSNGQVLIVGGDTSPSAAELYDPSSGNFASTGAPIQPHGYFHTATLLNDGRVLVVGGLVTPGQGGLATDTNAGAETYDPQSGTFTKAGAMFANRNLHTATLLADGRVLVAGGYARGDSAPGNVRFDTAELYDPSTGNFSPTSPMTEARSAHAAALLPDGKVLLAGGDFNDPSAELFDPVSTAFSATGSMNNPSRSLSQAVVLSSGQVLIAGGQNPGTVATNSAELYNPASAIFTSAGSMVCHRTLFALTALLDGRQLATGGDTAGGTGGCNGVVNASGFGFFSVAELYTPTTQGLVSSQSGLTFRFAQGSSNPSVQSVLVLSNTSTIPYTVTTHTYEGGSWLTAVPSSGNAVPGATPGTLIITANPSGLAAQDYYGSVTLTPTDAVHPPVSIAIVVHIVPAGTTAPPVVSPTGLLLIGPPAATLNPQNFNVTNLTSSAVSFTASGSNTPKFFSFTPSSGSIPAAQIATVTVTPNIAGLTAGVYNGTITLTFGDGSTQTVSLLLVVSPTTTGHARETTTAPPTCTASKLLPVFTSIGGGFNTPTSWPVPIFITVVDNCGDLINSGNVIVSFSDGDPPIPLLSTGGGNWSATWVPVAASAGFTARADATQTLLTGSASVSGQVLANPAVPVVSLGGVVSSIDFSSAPSVGLLVSIFGSNLADSALSAPLPLPPQLGTTSVLLSTGESLPILFVDGGLINVQIPYDVPLNTGLQLVVQRGPAVSVPVSIAAFAATPAIISENGSGSGQADVFVIGTGGIETLADQNHPATAGNPVVIYCVGLGAVNPGITAGMVSPGSPLQYANANVTVTFGNQTVTAAFAGLTPGEVGLYQVNATIPAGVPTGNQVPVVISAGGASSSGATFMAIH